MSDFDTLKWSSANTAMMRTPFLNAIRNLKKVRVTFYSKEDGRNLTRLCAPMDIGPSRRAKDQSDRFHMWDYESDEANHTLSLLPDQIVSIEPVDEPFDPADFITWDTSKSTWFVKRNWGRFS